MKKKILAVAIAAIMVLTALASVSLAYLMDTDDDTNTFTVGNVQIEQYEKDRDGNDFEDQKLYPIINDSKDEDGYHLGGNYVDKIVTVKNTGTEDAYIRTHIAIPAALDNPNASQNVLHWNGASASYTAKVANPEGSLKNDWYWGKDATEDWPTETGNWNTYYTTINGVKYIVYVVTHASKVAPGEVTAPTLFGVYLDEKVNWSPELGYFLDNPGTENDIKIEYDLSKDIDIHVVSEAVQAQGWGDDANVAFTALDQAFGEVGTYCPFGGTVVTPAN